MIRFMYVFIVLIFIWSPLVFSYPHGEGVLSAQPVGSELTDNDDILKYLDFIENYGERALPNSSKKSVNRRFPPYNFGLGKRSRPTSNPNLEEYDYHDNMYEQLIKDLKRGRQYAFGLGKREATLEEDRRSIPKHRYGFGLGR